MEIEPSKETIDLNMINADNLSKNNNDPHAKNSEETKSYTDFVSDCNDNNLNNSQLLIKPEYNCFSLNAEHSNHLDFSQDINIENSDVFITNNLNEQNFEKKSPAGDPNKNENWSNVNICATNNKVFIFSATNNSKTKTSARSGKKKFWKTKLRRNCLRKNILSSSPRHILTVKRKIDQIGTSSGQQNIEAHQACNKNLLSKFNACKDSEDENARIENVPVIEIETTKASEDTNSNAETKLPANNESIESNQVETDSTQKSADVIAETKLPANNESTESNQVETDSTQKSADVIAETKLSANNELIESNQVKTDPAQKTEMKLPANNESNQAEIHPSEKSADVFVFTAESKDVHIVPKASPYKKVKLKRDHFPTRTEETARTILTVSKKQNDKKNDTCLDSASVSNSERIFGDNQRYIHQLVNNDNYDVARFLSREWNNKKQNCDENNDHTDPNWRNMEKLRYDNEKFNFIRKRWRPLMIPNPFKNLTIKNDAATTSRRPVENRSRRNFLSIGAFYDNLYRETENIGNDVYADVVNRNQMEYLQLLNRHANEWSRDTHSCQNMHILDQMQNQEKEYVFEKHTRRTELALAPYSSRMNKLNSAREEVKKYYALYRDASMTSELYNEFNDIENVFENYEQVYGPEEG